MLIEQISNKLIGKNLEFNLKDIHYYGKVIEVNKSELFPITILQEDGTEIDFANTSLEYITIVNNILETE